MMANMKKRKCLLRTANCRLTWLVRVKYLLFLFLLVFNISCELLDDIDPDSDDPRDEIEDTWLCRENSSIYGISNYYVDISKSPDNNSEIIIDNFYNLGMGIDIYAILNKRTIEIPPQIIDGNSVSGNGNISSDYKTINFQYTVDDQGGEIDNISAIYTR